MSKRSRSKPEKLWPSKAAVDAARAAPEPTTPPPTDTTADDRDDQAPPLVPDEFQRRLTAMQISRSITRAIVTDAPDDEQPSREQLARMLGRYRAVVEGRLSYANLEPGIDKLRRAAEATDAAEAALRGGRYSDARHLVGLVQGILYSVGIHTWEYLVGDDER
jgi:hypothetical protein